MKSPKYLAWVRTLPCFACGRSPGGVAHHRTGAGMGKKASDRETMPLCQPCHQDFHDLRGMFRGFDRAHIRQWQEMGIQWTLWRAGLHRLRRSPLASRPDPSAFQGA